MSLLLAAGVMVFFSWLAFFGRIEGKPRALLFMLAAGASVMTGFYWYDTYTTNLGLSIGILLVAYALVCLGFALQCIFWKGKRSEE